MREKKKNFLLNCIICKKDFSCSASNGKTCSDKCFRKHRSNRRKTTSEKNDVIVWVLEKIKEKYEEKENFMDFRPSVDCLADVKFGELLETPKSHIGHNIIGNDKCEGLKTNMDWTISSQAP